MEESAVAEALLYGDREAKVRAARVLDDLTSKQRHKLVERGIICPLISMLQLQDFEAIEASLLALLSLACGSERNKVRIGKSGAIPLLVDVLHWQNGQLFELTIAALLILSSCTANKMVIAASGAIQPLVDILSSRCSMQAKLDAISTLQNLTNCHQMIQGIALSGTAVALLQLINESDRSSQLVEKAMALLEKIVDSSEAALTEAAGIDGAIQMLVEAVEEGSHQCREHAVVILLTICKSCRERYRGLILREGAMPGLLQLSIDGTRRAREKASDLLLLLRDGSNRGSRGRQTKNVILEQFMRQIDVGERAGTEHRLVEEMIAKLRT